MPTDIKPNGTNGNMPESGKPFKKGDLVGKRLLYAVNKTSLLRGSHVSLQMGRIVSLPLYVAYVISTIVLSVSILQWVDYWTLPASNNLVVGALLALVVYFAIRKLTDFLTGYPMTEALALSIATTSNMFAAVVDPSVDEDIEIEFDDDGMPKL